MSDLYERYFTRSALPYWSIMIIDLMIVLVAGVLSAYLVSGGAEIVSHFWDMVLTLVLTWPVYMLGMRMFHTYAGILRYSSFVDLLRVALALLVGSLLAQAVTYVLTAWCGVTDVVCFPEERMIVTFLLAMIGQWTVRILAKYLYDTAFVNADAKRVYIFGVRDGGISLAKSMRNEHPKRYHVKGFVTDEADMEHRYLLGSPVYAADDELARHIAQDKVNIIFVSPLCSERFRDNQALVDLLTHAGVHIMMMPAAETWDGRSQLSHQQLREVQIEDLLPRDKIEVDMQSIGAMLQGKRILITGAAGSIGSEMVRQVARFAPAELVLIDQAETPMHDLRLYMNGQHPDIPCLTVVGNISNASHMEQLFGEHRPEYVFHAAAYKHVPMMEDNPAMAVQNNVYGTRVIADLAVKYGTRKFVMISTDKAVNPTNVMGCSKRICEIYCQSLNAHQETCQFITTRFGNVLGSNGSVIPIFREQIRKGGPVTVTHPDIIRFFMLIPEACQLVLEAGTMGHGGEIFVFDMGKPVRIADLAQRMIDLSGAKNIEIQYSGLRDGEKLYEEVLCEAEQTLPTVHPKIKVATVRQYPYEQALANEEELYRLSFGYDDMAIVAKMKAIVPEYRSQNSKYETLDA